MRVESSGVMKEREGEAAYDADFVVLERFLGVKLATFDRKLLQWFPDVAMKLEDIAKLEEE